MVRDSMCNAIMGIVLVLRPLLLDSILFFFSEINNLMTLIITCNLTEVLLHQAAKITFHLQIISIWTNHYNKKKPAEFNLLYIWWFDK